MVELEAVLGVRATLSNSKEEMEVLIKWKGLSHMEAT